MLPGTVRRLKEGDDSLGLSALIQVGCFFRQVIDCPSCSAKRAPLWAEFVREQVIRPVLHRHLVFALPRILRSAFRYRGSF